MSELSKQEQVKQLWTDSEFHKLEWEFINQLLTPEQKNHAERLAVTSVASNSGMNEDRLREFLGEKESQSIWGGQVGNRFKEICLDLVETQIEKSKELICESVCVEFQYCRKREEKQFEGEGFLLALGIVDAMLNITTGLPFPVTSISVYLVKKKLLDKWCDCK